MFYYNYLTVQVARVSIDYFKGKSSIIKNGFEEVGIVHTIENQVISEAKEDPFADIDLNITIETLIITLGFWSLRTYDNSNLSCGHLLFYLVVVNSICFILQKFKVSSF